MNESALVVRCAAFALAAASLGGCSQVLGIESDRTLNEETDVFALPQEWSCLDDEAPASSGAAMVEQTMFLYDVTGASMSKPVSGLSVRACPRIDFACDTPVTGFVTSGADGIAVMRVPNGFNGYYEVSGRTEYQKYLVVENTILADSRSDVPVAPLVVSESYAAAAGVSLRPDAGIVLLTSRNCSDVATPGVTFRVSTSSGANAGALIYLVNSLPTGNGTATDKSGAAVMFNVTPGALNATASASSDTLMVGTRTGVVRAGWETQLHFYPDQVARARTGGP